MIHLIPLDESTLDGLILDLDGSLRALVTNASEVAAFLGPMLVPSRDFQRRMGSAAPWLGYLTVESDDGRLVGVCAFKGGPNEAGEVEIAYGTVPEFEGLGYATQMAKTLVAIAFASSAVRRVTAHTLPESCVSTRVLRNAGLTLAGETLDPEDGRVWRWELARPGATMPVATKHGESVALRARPPTRPRPRNSRFFEDE